MAASPLSGPRILSLLPSATEICGALGLGEAVVGVTHECDVCPDHEGMAQMEARGLARVTVSYINPHVLEQVAIDEAVKASMEQQQALYELKEAEIARVRPNVVLTQALCAVCAPAHEDVVAVCDRLDVLIEGPDGMRPTIINLEPNTLEDVAETFVTVAEACGVRERGEALREEFHGKLRRLRAAVAEASKKPRVLMLEWVDPPFDGGHWVPDQISAAGAEVVSNVSGGKSLERTWEALEALDPDVIVVACCGFELPRNLADARKSEPLKRFRAARQGRLFAIDGNRYFARPAPSLAEGAALMARVAHADDAATVERIEALDFFPGGGWDVVA